MLYTSTNRVFKINNSRCSRFFQQLCNKRSDVTNSGCWTQFCAHDSWRKLNVNIFQKIHWEKETSISLLLSLWFQKHLRNFQCTTRRSWSFMVDWKRSNILGFNAMDFLKVYPKFMRNSFNPVVSSSRVWKILKASVKDVGEILHFSTNVLVSFLFVSLFSFSTPTIVTKIHFIAKITCKYYGLYMNWFSVKPIIV